MHIQGVSDLRAFSKVNGGVAGKTHFDFHSGCRSPLPLLSSLATRLTAIPPPSSPESSLWSPNPRESLLSRSATPATTTETTCHGGSGFRAQFVLNSKVSVSRSLGILEALEGWMRFKKKQRFSADPFHGRARRGEVRLCWEKSNPAERQG